jgi:hypothetical protein
MTQIASPNLVIPKLPRKVTRRAKRRAWAEMGVEFWWKSAIVIALVAVFVGFFAARDALKLEELIVNGIPVKATLVEVKSTSRPGYAVLRDDDVAVKLRWTANDGRVNEIRAVLPPAQGFARVGESMIIRVDPKNSENWTELSDILPWWRILTIPLLLMLPISIFLFGIAMWMRWRKLQIWRWGRPVEGLVVGTRNASTSPRSRIVRYTFAEGSDKRVFQMLYPMRAGIPAEGDPLQLIVHPRQPERSIAAALYAETAQAE